MPRERKEVGLIKGAEEKAEADKKVAKIKADAIKELQASTDGFAMFFVKKDKRGKHQGIQQIVGGAMSIHDTMDMAMALRDTSQLLAEGVLDGFREYTEE